ncbi:hypothetical protein ABVV53_13640 [Novosphingobium sp. RD2P27]|uniref:Secreted protein n=1 Tax=Novosphingobium kalidii TaxID=3230299 RepID=A0ABV2D3M6_9SPHN
MKMALTACLGAGLMLALASPSFAASVSPTSYPFTLKGGGNLTQGGNVIWPCGWTLQAQTTSSSGGTISGGTGDTNPNCNQLSVGSTTWSVTSATAGVLHGLSINGPNIFCSTSANVPFTIMKSGNQATSFFFNSVNFAGNCNFNANLNTGAALTVNP